MKLSASFLLISFSITYSLVEYKAPTAYARNIFFYADYFVANEVIIDGFVPTGTQLSNSLPTRWGKIGTVIDTPVLPIFLSIIRIVSGIPISMTYTAFPAILLIASGLYILMRRMGLSILPRTILSVTGGIAAPTTAYYPISAPGTALGILFLSIAAVALHTIYSQNLGTRKYIHKVGLGFPLTIFLAFLFYRYPPNFGILGLVIISIGFLRYLQGKKVQFYLPLFCIIFLIGLQIFEIPLGAYVNNISLILLNIFELNFSNPLGQYSSSATPNTYNSEYYSIIPLPILLPIALVGGVYTILDLRDSQNIASTVAISWGIVAFVLSLVYVLTSEGWLVGRSYFFAFPVMLLGAARFLSQANEYVKLILPVLLIVLVLVSLFLQLGTGAIAIHTYEPGIKTGSQWAGDHVPGDITTDQKLGAPMAAKGDFSAEYQRNYSNIHSIYYTDNYSEFANSTDNPVLLSKGMTEYGFRSWENLHTPMSVAGYNSRIHRSNHVYSNGNVSLIRTRP